MVDAKWEARLDHSTPHRLPRIAVNVAQGRLIPATFSGTINDGPL